uniref:VWFD domain-containing protein n=1 Tax=Macrostomum lignano TaxID=282301 RepID=A0A1I8JNB8_9PLAT
MHHFQGACSYTLARDGCSDGKPTGPASFEVVQKNWRKNRPASVVTWTKEILVKVFGKTVVLRQGMRVVLDGQLVNLPAEPLDSAGRPLGFTIRFFEGNVLLTTRFGLYVKWNGDDRIEVKVETPFKRQMCGLCGDFDNNASNDWVLGPVCEPSGNATDNARLFGDSWRTDTGAMDGDECKPGCSETPDPECVGNAHERAKTTCNRLREIFAPCAAAMAAVKDSFDVYIDSCVYDTCLGGVDLCQTATTIAAVCQSRYNSSSQWRRADFCPKTCGENQHYESCASPCQPTCVQPNVTALMASGLCAGRCTEACVCNEGYVMTSGRCVRPSRCGCQVDGLYYNIGDMMIKPNCTERCNCTSPGATSLTCTSYGCHKYGFCGFENDMYDCHCKKGFHGNGVVCDDTNLITPCMRPNVCVNGICTELPQGKYRCDCRSGYELRADACSGKCKCLEPTFSATTGPDGELRCVQVQDACTGVSCPANSTCQGANGGAGCVCNFGLHFNPAGECVDIRECENPLLNDCDLQNGRCVDLVGAYRCECSDGFSLDSATGSTPGLCSSNATCVFDGTNTRCICKSGYVGNGRICVADNSCTAGTHTCDVATSTCVPRKPIGFDCECKPGFHKEGNLCVDNDECDPASPYFRPGVCGDPLMAKDRGNSTYDCRCPADQLDKGVESCASGVCVHFCQKVDPCWTRAP